MKKIILAISVSAMSIGLGGCATVMNGTNQDVTFQSDPDGAVVALSTGQTCDTPCEFPLKRGKDLRVDFTMPGYKSEYVYVQSRLGGSTFGNIIAGGVVGGIVDGSNGASNHLYPRPVYIRLVAQGSTEEAMLLDKDGEVISTVAEHNAKVAEDVQKGMREQGLDPLESFGS